MFLSILDKKDLTIPRIQQQMVLHDVMFTPNATKRDLIEMIKSSNWTDEVNE